MDIFALKALLLDIDCMTALRHVTENPAVASLIRLCRVCAQEQQDAGVLTDAYCAAYDAWLSAAAKGRGGFVRETLEAVLFEDSAAASLCARMDEVPYSLMNALAHDLEALGKLASIEPAMFLLLCERAGLPGQMAARLPVWEPVLGGDAFDPRIDRDMLSRDGARRVAAFFRKQGTGLFARCPGCTWVGVSGAYPLGLRGIREPDPIRLEDMVLYEQQRDTLEEKFSLADRFDLRLTFAAPTQEGYFAICRALLDAQGIEYDWEALMPRARAWTVSHNGCSPRIARQFVDYIAGERPGPEAVDESHHE